jgi:hypothetical protein
MSKAEERALEAYPNEHFVDHTYAEMCRGFYEEGYEQAEEDLALTPDDIKLITKIHYEIVFKDTTGIKVGDVASEVLKRYLEASHD